MSRLTVVALLFLVAGLGFLAWRQAVRQDADVREVPLFEGLGAHDVHIVRIENLLRGEQMTFERDGAGGWTMTDPVHVRAESSFLEPLVQSVVARRGTPVEESEADAEKLGLEPPRYVIELIPRTGPRQRIDVGAVDLDRNRVHVRARGLLLRTLRDFEVLLDIHPEEYQSHSATTLQVREVVELHRRGRVFQPGAAEPSDVTLDALLEEGRWRSTAPAAALLDPVAMGLVLQNTAGLRFERFNHDAGASLAALGLDPPAISFELVTLGGETVEIRFGTLGAGGGTWNGMTVGDARTWHVPGEIALALAVPLEELVDRRLQRFPLADVDGVHIATSEREVRIEKSLFGWTVAEANPGSRVFEAARPADPRRVSDLLGALDRVEYRAVLVDAPFADSEARDTVHVRTRGAVAGGAFGRAHESGGVRFRRDGETVVGVVEDSFLELVRTPPQEFWSTSIAGIAEVEVQRLVLRRGSDELAFERDRYGKWVRPGRTEEARELVAVLDPLLFLRASRHLSDSTAPLADPIEVHWTLSDGRHEKLAIGRAEADGGMQVVAEMGGRRSVLQRQDLHERLAGLFAGG